MKHLLLCVMLFCGYCHAEIVRQIAPPAYFSNSAQTRAAIKHSTYQNPAPVTLWDQWNLEVRHQGVSIDAFNTSFNTINNTGISVPSSYQYGPKGGAVAQSVFQLYQYNVGALIISWDSIYPYDAPGCNATLCAGWNKHTAYQYKFSNPPKLFDPALGYADNVSLALQGNFRVTQFDKYDYTGPSIPVSTPISSLSWVVFLSEDDNSNPPIQIVITMYSSHDVPPWNFARRSEFPGSTAVFMTTSMNGTSVRPYTTIKADSAIQTMRMNPWLTQDFFRIHITPTNLRNIITDYNDQFTESESSQRHSLAVEKYRLQSVTVLQEIEYAKEDYAVFGASYYAPGVYELKQ